MMVALPNGTIVHHINANFFLDQTSMKPDDGEEQDGTTFSFSGGFEDPSTSTYISFLKEGLERSKPPEEEVEVWPLGAFQQFVTVLPESSSG
uniref:Uncharacterized protein n=1 Tax=Hippocampus comes TaxID=109280 RepID=A0A3Q2Z4R8_HIPCM